MDKCCITKVTVGEIPSSFKESLSYYEALCVVIDKVNELATLFNTILLDKISAYINEHFNDIMMDALYEASTETLILKLSED
ncbi:MAG: hypothetical protein J6S85_01255 [Methanobrevibacter sp.]|nr:hypothetical protein [Methanobrevibacter sp.]